MVNMYEYIKVSAVDNMCKRWGVTFLGFDVDDGLPVSLDSTVDKLLVLSNDKFTRLFYSQIVDAFKYIYFNNSLPAAVISLHGDSIFVDHNFRWLNDNFMDAISYTISSGGNVLFVSDSISSKLFSTISDLSLSRVKFILFGHNSLQNVLASKLHSFVLSSVVLSPRDKYFGCIKIKTNKGDTFVGSFEYHSVLLLS
jgi:hypothetical protein